MSVAIMFFDVFAIINTASSVGASVAITIRFNSAAVASLNITIMCIRFGAVVDINAINANAGAWARILRTMIFVMPFFSASFGKFTTDNTTAFFNFSFPYGTISTVVAKQPFCKPARRGYG